MSIDTSKLKMYPSIQLASGNYFDFLEPDKTPLGIEDIATGLSRICRFTGHLENEAHAIYSVAQHCVLASENCDPDCDPYEALMHDRVEAVLSDISSPLKQLLPDYKALEERLEAATAELYSVPHPMSAACKRIDIRMLATEKRDIMPKDKDGAYWALLDNVEPLPFTIRPWSPVESKYRFLHRYRYTRFGLLPKKGSKYGYAHEGSPADYKEKLYAVWGHPLTA